jgi:hypothetical protein
VKKKIARQLRQRKRKIRNRLDKRTMPEHPSPMLNPGNIHYEISDRSNGVLYGGIGVVQMLVKRLELDEAINRHLHLFKLHNPYFESDHVLNIAYNILCNGDCLEDIERLRNDHVYLDSVGADRIPDPTTAGDFCRRFSVKHVEILQEIINEIRLKVWSQQSPEFFAEAIIDADGTDFSQTEYLDGWDDQGVTFVFGISAMPNLVKTAENLSETAWGDLIRPPKHVVKTKPRTKPVNVKEQIVKERGYKNIRLQSEQVAEFEYRPVKCRKSYRLVVLRKNLSIEKGEAVLFDDIRYFFYITNDRKATGAHVIGDANNRCNQENLIEQLKNGVRAMRMPVDDLVSNWAYMVMASLAWNLKAWYALLLPVKGQWHKKHKAEKRKVLRMEFKKFRNFFIMLPSQIVKTGRKLVYRLLGWNEYLDVFFRAVTTFRRPLRC